MYDIETFLYIGPVSSIKYIAIEVSLLFNAAAVATPIAGAAVVETEWSHSEFGATLCKNTFNYHL